MKRRGYILITPEFKAQDFFKEIVNTLFPKGYVETKEGLYIRLEGENKKFIPLTEHEDAKQYFIKIKKEENKWFFKIELA